MDEPPGTRTSNVSRFDATSATKPTQSVANVALVVPVLGNFNVRVPAGSTREAAARICAERQHGYVRIDQLTRIGWTARAVRVAVDKGLLTPVARGVVRFGPDPRRPLAAEVEALLVVGVDAYLTGTSALAALRLVPHRSGPVHVGAPRRVRPRDGIRIHHHPTVADRDLTRLEGLPMTTVERALLDAAPHLDPKQLVKAFDEARHRHLTSPTKLRELLARRPRHPGAGKLRRLADPARRSQRTESALADRARELVLRAGLPTPMTEPNLLGLGYRADLYWPDAHLALEIDSFEFHGNDERNFHRDRVKERAWEQHGIATVRWSDEDVTEREPQIVAQLAVRLHQRREQLRDQRAEPGPRG